VEKGKMEGIIAGKDIFRAIINNRALILVVNHHQWIKGCYSISLVSIGYLMVCKRDKNLVALGYIFNKN
jgi:hypothetical protein